MSKPTVDDAELESAIRAISDPRRLRHAQELVERAAPSLQRVLARALADGGWFDSGHRQAVREAVGEVDVAMRVRAVDTLLAEETRLAMLVGVAVGFELARELPQMPSSPRDDARLAEDNDDQED
jgi:hypothetical protein